MDLEVATGQVIAILGASGSGKSTLLYCLAGVLRPRSGSVLLDGVRIDNLGDQERARVRLEHFGFVFQFGALVPELTLRENVELPLRLLGRRATAARSSALRLLEELGVAEVSDRRPAQVSGGQVQRAAVARALVHGPRVVFADEPTGALDSASRDLTLELLLGAAKTRGAAVVLVTHDDRVARTADACFRMHDGALSDAGVPASEGAR
ncbi:MAG: ABC transporter ATP-binding protein [Kineosporiaceae bacterium]